MSKSYGRCDYCGDEMDWSPVVVPTSSSTTNTFFKLKFCDLDHAVHYFYYGPAEDEEGEV